MKKADLYFNVVRLPVDFLMLLVAGLVTYTFRTEILSAFRPVLFEFNLPLTKYLYLVLFVSFLFIGAYAVSGLYSMRSRMGPAEEFLKVLIASSAGIMIVIIYIFLSLELFNSRFLVLGGWFFAVIFVFLGRLIVRYLQSHLVSKYNFGVHKVMIVGSDQAAYQIIEAINKSPSAGYRIVKHLIRPEVAEIKSAVGNPGVNEVILTDPSYQRDKVAELVDFCNENHLVFKFVPSLYSFLTTNFGVDSVSNLPLIELKRTSLEGWGSVIKRVMDIGAGVLGLVIFSPVFLMVALAVKSESEGSVFARLKRVSRNREFYLFKFRSMVKGAEELKPSLVAFSDRAGPLFKMRSDPRVTKVGRFLRRYRIDELPQFWNILKGDISLVGPRPHEPGEISQYQKHHRRVLAIKAGATGLAQVSGSSDLPFDQEVILDSFYIENWSLTLDLKVILKTIFRIFTDRSAV